MDMQTPPCNTTSESQCGVKSSPYALIVIPVLLAFSTVVVVALIVYSVCCKKREQAGTAVFSSNTTGKTATGCGSVLMRTVTRALASARDALGPWEIPEDSVLEELAFLHTDSASQAEVKEFVNWARFHAVVSRHENLVQMLFCQTRRLPIYLVLEAVSPGNLLHFLWTLRNEYLHSEHKLVHGDVAARSVLIGAGLSVRVAGLGMAFEAWETGRVANQRAAEVPLKWQAPERIMRLPMTTRSDVWSFGILLYELVTLGAPPYPELEPLDVFPQIQSSYRMKKPENCGTPLYDLMKYCWMWNSNDRPMFSTIISLLKSYTDLADAKNIYCQESMNIFEYSKKAGVFP